MSIKIARGGKTKLRLQLFSCASFASSVIFSSQLGHFIVLKEKLINFILSFRHLTKSEKLLCVRSWNNGICQFIWHGLHWEHNMQMVNISYIPFYVMTDSLCQFDILTKAYCTIERGLMLSYRLFRTLRTKWKFRTFLKFVLNKILQMQCQKWKNKAISFTLPKHLLLTI